MKAGGAAEAAPPAGHGLVERRHMAWYQLPPPPSRLLL